jgi:hypothetical protein
MAEPREIAHDPDRLARERIRTVGVRTHFRGIFLRGHGGGDRERDHA